MRVWVPVQEKKNYTLVYKNNSFKRDQTIKKTPLTNAPPSLSSIQCLGALSLFKCFFNPLACINNKYTQKSKHNLREIQTANLNLSKPKLNNLNLSTPKLNK